MKKRSKESGCLYTTYRMEDSLDADDPRLHELAQFSDNEDFCQQKVKLDVLLFLSMP